MICIIKIGNVYKLGHPTKIVLIFLFQLPNIFFQLTFCSWLRNFLPFVLVDRFKFGDIFRPSCMHSMFKIFPEIFDDGKSGDCEGYSKSFSLHFLKWFEVDSEVSFGSLFCCRSQPRFSFTSYCITFASKICWYLESILISICATGCHTTPKQNTSIFIRTGAAMRFEESQISPALELHPDSS